MEESVVIGSAAFLSAAALLLLAVTSLVTGNRLANGIRAAVALVLTSFATALAVVAAFVECILLLGIGAVLTGMGVGVDDLWDHPVLVGVVTLLVGAAFLLSSAATVLSTITTAVSTVLAWQGAHGRQNNDKASRLAILMVGVVFLLLGSTTLLLGSAALIARLGPAGIALLVPTVTALLAGTVILHKRPRFNALAH